VLLRLCEIYKVVVAESVKYMSHFSLWAISKAPLIIGCDVMKMIAATLSTLTNSEVIADHDSLGIQGKKVAVTSLQSPNTSSEIIISNCLSSNINLTRHQWTYNSQDGSIRSLFNGRCLSIDQCSTRRVGYAVLNDYRIGDP
jgi:hypothetical protein